MKIPRQSQLEGLAGKTCNSEITYSSKNLKESRLQFVSNRNGRERENT